MRVPKPLILTEFRLTRFNISNIGTKNIKTKEIIMVSIKSLIKGLLCTVNSFC